MSDDRADPDDPSERADSPDPAGSRDPTDSTGGVEPTEAAEPREPSRRPGPDAGAASGRAAVKSALLWGVVAALAFLVLAQGYQLLEFGTLPLNVVVVGTAAVFAATTLLTYLLGP